MATPPSNLSFYGITQNSAFLQWYSNGSDTNYADILCYATSNLSTPVFSGQNIHTPNTQYYSSQITGLNPGTRYVCFIHTKLDQYGTGESVLIKSPEFTTQADTSGNPLTNPLAQQLIYVKTNIAGYFFDAILHENYSRSLTITSHPVETGANISDHAFINPTELTMLIGMTDVATSIIDGQFSQGQSRSVEAFKVLQSLQEQKVPLQVMSKFGLFKNMLVETISAPDDYTTVHALKATVLLKEIFVATVKTVKISARPHVTDSTNKGTVNPVKPNESLAYQVEQLVKGFIAKFLGPNGGIQ